MAHSRLIEHHRGEPWPGNKHREAPNRSNESEPGYAGQAKFMQRKARLHRAERENPVQPRRRKPRGTPSFFTENAHPSDRFHPARSDGPSVQWEPPGWAMPRYALPTSRM